MHDLNISTIADGQADGQWQTSNDADAAIANALADIATVDFSGGNVTMSAATFRAANTFKASAALAAARTLTLPAVKRPFEYHNTDATYTVTLKKTNGASPETATSIAVPPGYYFRGYTDGTATGLYGAIFVSATIGDLDAGTIYDFGMAFGATPAAGDVMGRVRVAENLSIAANMAGSYGGVSVNPDATFAIDVQDDGVSIGTISVATGGAVTFTTTSGTAKSVAAGSEIKFVAPANSPAEASVEGGSFVIRARVA